MSDEARLRWLVVAATGIGGSALAAASGLSVRWQEVPAQGIGLGCIALGGIYFHYRGNQRFAETVAGMMQMLVFTIGFTVAMYAVCALGRPLVDDRLAAWDAALGVHLPAVVTWVQRHPETGVALGMAYHSLLPQTVFAIAVLGMTGRDRELHGFLMAFFLGLVLVLSAFALWPAAGPFAKYGFEPSAVQRRYLEHFHGFRSGAFSVISWRAAEGLVTFPSFHTAAALLLAHAMRWNRWLFVPSAVLNLAVIVSTMTTGWHYFVDVVGGVALAAASVALCPAWDFWRRRRAGARPARGAGRRWRCAGVQTPQTPATPRPLFRESRRMFGNRQISWPGLLAAATLVFVVVAASRSSDWSFEAVNRLILGPLREIVRLSW
jgi:membrane-associated phospholipid phosphatase